MNPELEKAANIIVNKCMGLMPDESCLIITDSNKKNIAEAILHGARKVSSKSKLIMIPVGKVNGQEPPEYVARKMQEFDVVIIPTTMSMSHTKARKDATAKGVRLSTMPGITEDIMSRAINVDYDEMKELTNKISDVLDSGKTVKITTKIGTDITINVEGKQSHGRKAGLFTKSGEWGNLPEAETAVGPVQKGTNGVYVVDASQAGVGKLETPIKITVVAGFATKIEGGTEAEKLREMLEGINDKNAYNIAELGIGTNKKAIITGVVLEDEKVFGTFHIALGNNMSLDGDVDVPIHVDGVMKEPTIIVDGQAIMRDGKLLI